MFQDHEERNTMLHDLSMLQQKKLYALLLEKSVLQGHIDPRAPLLPETIREDLNKFSIPVGVQVEASRSEVQTPTSPSVGPASTSAQESSRASFWLRWWRLLQQRPALRLGAVCATFVLCLVSVWLGMRAMDGALWKSGQHFGMYDRYAQIPQFKRDARTQRSTCAQNEAANLKSVVQVKVRVAASEWRRCVGVIIGPHAVLTTTRCRGDHERYREDRHVRVGDQELLIDNDFSSPYTVTVSYFKSFNLPIPLWRRSRAGIDSERPFAPAWFLRMHNMKRQVPAPFPGMHNLHVMVVPQLTPNFLRKHELAVAHLDADFFVRLARFGGEGLVARTVGVVLPDGDRGFRLHRARLQKDEHEPGMLSLKRAGHVHDRDLGSPVFGFKRQGQKLCPTRVLIGMLHDTSNLAPLAYHTSAPLATSRYTHDATRRNSLWLLARLHDLDNDGITSFCDPAPMKMTALSKSRCPVPVGKPQASTTKGYPMGLLMCSPQEAVAGVRGVYSGDGIMRVALLCRPHACLGQKKACPGEYWTHTYGVGLRGKGRYAPRSRTVRCASGQMIHKLHIETAAHQIFYIKPFCTSPKKPTLSRPQRAFGRLTGRLHTAACASSQRLAGLVMHHRLHKRISALQMICLKPQSL